MPVGMTIDFQGRRTRNFYARLLRNYRPEVMAEVEKARDEAYRQIRSRMSGRVLKVRTGRLRGSVRKTESRTGTRDETYSVTSNVPYGRYQEVGFRHVWSGKRIRNPIWLPVWRWAEERLFKRLARVNRRLMQRGR